MRWAKYLLTVIAGVTLTSCVTRDPQQIGPYPTDYRQLIQNHVRRSFFDPYSIRDAAISSPQEGHLFFQQGWIVCLEANAKNRMGGYTGLQRTAYLIRNDTIINSMDRAPLCNQVYLAPQPDFIKS